MTALNRLEEFAELPPPGGGPALNADRRWVRSCCRKVRRYSGQHQQKPHLVEVEDLRQRFRQYFLAGLKRLHRQGTLKLNDEFSHLRDISNFEAWLEPLKPLKRLKWGTFTEPPPSDKATPEHVLKYLARYMTGGPISDRRLISHENGRVAFRSRSGKTPGGKKTDMVTVNLSGTEFVRRWSMHILPKGYVKTRRFGGYSNHHRQRYITECRDLLLAEGVEHLEPQTEPPESAEPATAEQSYELTCPDCGAAMLCIAATDTDNDVNLRAEAIMGLAQYSNSTANRAVLLSLLRSSNEAVQIESLRTLRGLASTHSDVCTALIDFSRQYCATVRESRVGHRQGDHHRRLTTQLIIALRGIVGHRAERVREHLQQLAGREHPKSLTAWQQRLKYGGDPSAGRRVFFHSNGPQCSRCHTHRSRGGSVASDLTGMGRAMFIESIIAPSKKIPPQYFGWTLLLHDGRVYSGMILEEFGDRIVLGSDKGEQIELHARDIEERKVQSVSLMPKDLVHRMTVEEFRDLVAFLKASR